MHRYERDIKKDTYQLLTALFWARIPSDEMSVTQCLTNSKKAGNIVFLCEGETLRQVYCLFLHQHQTTGLFEYFNSFSSSLHHCTEEDYSRMWDFWRYSSVKLWNPQTSWIMLGHKWIWQFVHINHRMPRILSNIICIKTSVSILDTKMGNHLIN